MSLVLASELALRQQRLSIMSLAVDDKSMQPITWFELMLCVSFSAFTLWVTWQEGHLPVAHRKFVSPLTWKHSHLKQVEEKNCSKLAIPGSPRKTAIKMLVEHNWHIPCKILQLTQYSMNCTYIHLSTWAHASGRRCRKTSPRRPPTAKLSSSFSFSFAAAVYQETQRTALYHTVKNYHSCHSVVYYWALDIVKYSTSDYRSFTVLLYEKISCKSMMS